MKRNIIILTAVTMVLAGQAYALELAGARASGLVCEKGDGYIADTGTAGADVAALISSVNSGRKTEYARISASKGQPIDVVAKLAAQQIIAKGNALCK